MLPLLANKDEYIRLFMPLVFNSFIEVVYDKVKGGELRHAIC